MIIIKNSKQLAKELDKNKENLNENLNKCVIELFKDQEYIKAIAVGTTDPESIKTRFEVTKKYFVKK